MSAKQQAHRWRDQIEALSMAIVVALLFKVFILEISKIPSGSMQPTLMGNPATGIFDRILVDKLSYRFREPRRFEIVVFRHPLERSRIMVKRLVGMPGEELRIEHGDIWVRASADDEWRVLRRPPDVQRAMWKRLDRDQPKRPSWSLVARGKEWRLSGRSIRAHGDGRARFRADLGEIRDAYTDGYPDLLLDELAGGHPQSGAHAVGDLRLEGEVRADAGLELLAVELTEGNRTYHFLLPGPAGEEGSAPTIELRDPSAGDGTREVHADPERLAAGRATRFAVENLDDRLALEIDGRTVAATDVEPSANQAAFVTIELRGEGAELEDLQVYRDTYYYGPDLPRDTWQVEIPAGHHVVLGDNTHDSADSRDWKSITMEWNGDRGPRSELGNYRPGLDAQNPVPGHPIDGELVGFRDRWGERHWFPFAPSAMSAPAPAPLVPSELIQGRALAVFWPVKPVGGLWPDRWLWRLGWLH